MNWEEAKLSDVCVSIYDGTHQAPPKSKDGVPFITISNVDKSNKIDFTDTAFVSKEYYDGIDEKRKARKGDILYTVVGSFGIPVYVKENIEFVFQRHIAILRPRDEIDAKFLYYTMLSRDFYMQADSVALGAAQRTITLNSLRNMTIKLPSFEVQQRIASILSVYDDLIENNQKQIKLLEEAAQRLYKEWFVDLRFPGYEDVEVVDGVPKGWSKKFFKDFVDYEIGGGWGEDYADREHTILATVIRGTDIDDIRKGAFKGLPSRYHKLSNFNARKLECGDIIFEVSGGSKTTGVAKSLLMDKNILKKMSNMVICASFCKLIRVTNPMYSQYIYDALQYSRNVGITEQFEKKSASSIINYNWKDFLQQFEVYLPKLDILEKYNQIAKKLYTEQMLCCIRISELQEARDRLLPKLMSGEVVV